MELTITETFDNEFVKISKKELIKLQLQVKILKEQNNIFREYFNKSTKSRIFKNDYDDEIYNKILEINNKYKQTDNYDDKVKYNNDLKKLISQTKYNNVNITEDLNKITNINLPEFF
jgi:hypothetical protein